MLRFIWTACLIQVLPGLEYGGLRTVDLAAEHGDELRSPDTRTAPLAADFDRAADGMLPRDWSQHLVSVAFGELVGDSTVDVRPQLNGRTVLRPFVLSLTCGVGVAFITASLTWRLVSYSGGSTLAELLQPKGVTSNEVKWSSEDEAAIEAWAQSVGSNSLLYRCIPAAFMTTTLVVEYYMSKPAYRFTFLLYLTHWTLILQCAHLIGGVWVTWRIRKATSTFERARILTWPATTMPIVYTTTTMVALGWWCLIFTHLNLPLWRIAKRWPIFWITHGMNAVFSFVEVLTVRQPLYFGDVYLSIGYCMAYVAFTIVYFYVVKGIDGSGANHLYEVLDFSSHLVLSMVVVVVVLSMVPLVHGIFAAIASCRKPPLMLGEPQIESQVDSADVGDDARQ